MQATKQISKQRINELKIQMNHHDPDLAEMAARQLTKIVVQDVINLKSEENKDLAKSITQQFLKQLESQNFQVNSNAIRSLAEIVPKLTKDLLILVFKTTIGSLTDPKVNSKKKQIFSSSAGSMISRAPSEIGNNLSGLFVECVTEFLSLSSRKNTKDEEQVLIHLLIIIINFGSKWPDVIGSSEVNYDRKQLILVLLRNVQNSLKIQLNMKCVSTLGTISLVMNRQDFEFVFNSKQYGLLNYIRNNVQSELNQTNLKRLKNGLSCLDQIVHAHNRQMKPWAEQLTVLCVNIVNKYKSTNADSDFDHQILAFTTEIIESSIDCLISLLKAYSSELSKWVGNGNYQFLTSFINDTLNFDPEGMMSYFQNQQPIDEEYQDEEQFNYAEGSICWKVREVSLNYVTMLMRKDNHFRDKTAKQREFINLLSDKLIEENENVCHRAFSCFNYIIESISATKLHKQAEEDFILKRVKSNDGNFAIELVDKISNKIQILFKHKKTKEQTKTQASKTLLNIIQLLNQLIKDNQKICGQVLDLIQQLLPKVKPDSCINLIKSSKTLLSGNFPYQKTQKMIDVYLNMSKNKNFKIVAACFGGLRNIIKYYGDNLIQNGKINKILDQIINKLKQHDADKTIKIQVIKCLGPIFENIFNKLPEAAQNNIIAVTQTKIKVQMDKTIILSKIAQIPDNFQIKPSQQKLFQSLLQVCSESIGNSSYQLNNYAIQSCSKLLKLLGNRNNPKTIQSILSKSLVMIGQNKTPKYIENLIDTYPKLIKPYAEIIVKTGNSACNLKIIKNQIMSVNQIVQILKSIANADNLNRLSVLYSQANPSINDIISQVNQTNWGRVCLGALGYVGDLSTIAIIQKLIDQKQSHDFKYEGAKAIGNIASRYPEFSLKLIQLYKTQKEGYLYLHALKQMLFFSKQSFPQLENIIHFIFQKAQENDRETSKHLLAECIGYVTRISSHQLSRIINSIPQMSPNRKFVVASSLKYGLEPQNNNNNNGEMLDEKAEEFIEAIVNLTKDNDVNVREGALKSLNSIVVGHIERIRGLLDGSFFNVLLDSMSIKSELIKIIDYGVGKEEKDLGRPLRIQAFNFFKAVINLRQAEDVYNAAICKCLENIQKQNSNDIILKRINIIRIICQKDFTIFTPHQQQFVTKVGVQGVLKAYTSDKAAEDERSEGYLKSLLKQILRISKLNKQSSDAMKTLLNKISSFEKLSKLLDSVQI